MALSSLPETFLFLGVDALDVSTEAEALHSADWARNLVHLSQAETTRKIGERLTDRDGVNALLDTHEKLAAEAAKVAEIAVARQEEGAWARTRALLGG